MDALGSPARRRALLVIAIIIGAAVVAVRSERSSTDLQGFHAVWAANWEHPDAGNRADPEDPYAPSFYVLFAPLGALPLWGAALVIYALNIAAVWGIVRMTVRFLDIPPPDYGQLWIPAIGVAPFFLGTLSLGQNTLMLIVLIFAAYTIARQGRELAAGCLIGLATAIKVYPVLFLAPFVLRLRLKVLAGFAATVVLIAGGLGTLFFGYENNVRWHQDWARFVTRADQAGPEDPHYPRTMRCTARYNNQAVHAVLARVMLDVPAKWYGERFQVNLWSCEAATWRTARTAAQWGFLALGAAALLALSWSRPRLRIASDCAESEDIAPDARELTVVCSWFFVTSPMVWTHYLVWAFFPLACAVRQRGFHRRGATLILAAWFAAECLIGSKVARAVGVNLGASLAMFGWFTLPCLRDAAITISGRWHDRGENTHDEEVAAPQQRAA